MFFTIKRKERYNYFKTMAELSNYSQIAAEYLKDCLTNFKQEKMPEMVAEMHKIEQAADEAKHVMMEKLIKEFLPPIDKDDIIMIAHQIDTVTDSIEDVLIFIKIDKYQEIHPDVLEFVELIITIVSHMKAALYELENYKKPEKIYKEINKVHHLKSKGKALYIKALNNLQEITSEPVQMIANTALFTSLEECSSNCKDVTNTIERIIIKNT